MQAVFGLFFIKQPKYGFFVAPYFVGQPFCLRACLNFRFAGENGQRKVLRKRFLSRVAALQCDKKANAGSFYGCL
ncbi:hypothetical protein [Rufibacter sp. XAAS-G3-1]|uniref:hypothetical protein n=1 Tax=Rufibacter sp. XAAS-G3-1 TaxID=2729134 RepID=UPI0015E6E047|nr:hypothetical protein [Rufibacter sp. XAAS-G3-1]